MTDDEYNQLIDQLLPIKGRDLATVQVGVEIVKLRLLREIAKSIEELNNSVGVLNAQVLYDHKGGEH